MIYIKAHLLSYTVVLFRVLSYQIQRNINMEL